METCQKRFPFSSSRPRLFSPFEEAACSARRFSSDHQLVIGSRSLLWRVVGLVGDTIGVMMLGTRIHLLPVEVVSMGSRFDLI